MFCAPSKPNLIHLFETGQCMAYIYSTLDPHRPMRIVVWKVCSLSQRPFHRSRGQALSLQRPHVQQDKYSQTTQLPQEPEGGRSWDGRLQIPLPSSALVVAAHPTLSNQAVGPGLPGPPAALPLAQLAGTIATRAVSGRCCGCWATAGRG